MAKKTLKTKEDRETEIMDGAWEQLHKAAVQSQDRKKKWWRAKKAKGFELINNGVEQLDIFIHKSNLRVSIHTIQNIENFCKSNRI